jgi:hypothetical protein
MTPSASRVCCWTLPSLSGTSFASKKADMRSWILVDSSWNGSGVSETRGSANPVAVFIAEAVLGSTSKRASAKAAAVCRLLVVGETVQGHGAWWTRSAAEAEEWVLRLVWRCLSISALGISPCGLAQRRTSSGHSERAQSASRNFESGRGRLHHPRANIGVLLVRPARVEQMPSRPEVVITRRYRL